LVFRLIDLRNVLRQNPSVREVLVLATAMIVATVVSAVAVLLDLRQRELAHARVEIVSLSRVLAEQTTRTFEGVALTLRGARERIAEGRRYEFDSLPVRQLLQARIAGLPQIKSLFLVDRQGLGVNSSRPDFIPRLSMAKREFFSHFANGGGDEIFISRPEKANVDGQWAYYASVSLVDGSGQFTGVLVASISIDYFESLYDSIHFDFVSRIQLLDREGVFLAGIPRDEALFGKMDGKPAVVADLNAQSKDGVVVLRDELAGQRWLVAYRQVAKYPLLISAAVNEDEALAPWRHLLSLITAGVALILALVLVTTVMMVRNLLRKGALEQARKESDEQLRHMVQSVTDAIVTVDSARHVVLFNGAAERMFGVRAEEAMGKELGELLCPRMREPQRENLQHYLDEGWHMPAAPPLLGTFELLRDEQALQVELSLSTTTFRGESLFTAVFRDMTERQRAERELLETNRQLQELSASLQNVREGERARIARELHDELGQLLTGIRMEVSWLGGKLSADQQVLVNKVDAIKGQIDQTVGSVRRISSELRPLVLDDLGFAAAAGWYVDQFSERTGLTVDLDLPAHDPAQGGVVATALFRILQESLTNVARHALATKVGVRLSLQGDEWALSIRDNGVGFEHDPGKREGIGLIGMRERTQILGGHFSVTTAPGEGTLIEVVIPAGKEEKVGNGDI